jgi:hypothetical protein
MADPYRKQRRLASALMLLAVVPLAFACWRLSVCRWGQPGAILRYDPSPLLADWERVSEQYKALSEKVRRDNPQADQSDEAALRSLEVVRERLTQDQEARLAEARRWELRFGLWGLVGAFVVFSAGYWWRDKLPTVG